MKFKLDGISMDLPYAKLKVTYVPEALKRLAGKVSLCGVHANKCMHSATCSKSGGIPVVVTVYQVWSKRRELFRFFWRHFAIAVAYNVNRTHSNLSLTILMTSFF